MRWDVRFGTPALVLAVLLPALLAGCLEGPADGTGVEGEQGGLHTGDADPNAPFAAAGAPPLAYHTWPYCGGPCIYDELFAVFENGRAIHVQFTWWRGNDTVVVNESVAYSEEELATLLQPLASNESYVRGNRTTARVSEVTAGTLPEPAFRNLTAALASNWTRPAPTEDPPGCVDCTGPGTFVKFLPNGSTDLILGPVHAEPDAPETLQFKGLVQAFRNAQAAFQPTPTPKIEPPPELPDPSPGTLVATAHDGNQSWWFTFREGGGLTGGVPEDARNPTLHARPGAHVRLILYNLGNHSHNLHIGAPIDMATPLIEPGGNATLEFTIPEDAPETIRYWCDPHKALGMSGQIRIQGRQQG